MDNKKILLYGGGAIALGAVGFFVWSFFQKVDVPLDKNTTDTSDDITTSYDKPTNAMKNYFQSLMDTKFEPIKTPDILDYAKNNFLR
jgi:hypothetical protein